MGGVGLPGLAWLEFHVEPRDDGASGSRLRQRATFHWRGLLGHLCWWAVAPFHGVVFGGRVRTLARAAETTPDGPFSGSSTGT